MSKPRDEPPARWVGRAPARRPADPTPTAEFPAIPAEPSVVYVEQPARRRVSVIIGLMLICFSAGAIVALLSIPGLRQAIGLGPGGGPGDLGTEQPSPTPPTPPPPPPPGIGDTVRDTTIEFVVTEIECGLGTVGEGIFTIRADGRYCVVGVVMTNVGGTLAILSDEHQFAVTADGSRHRADHDATVRANGSLLTSFLPVLPGDTVIGKVVFDIPEGAAITLLELHDSANSEGAVITP